MNDHLRLRAIVLASLVFLSSIAGVGLAGASSGEELRPALSRPDAAGSLGDPIASADWPTPGHDANRSGHNQNAVGPKTDVDARWVYEADNRSRHEPAVVADGRVFVPTRDGLHVLDNETGEPLWNTTDLNVERVSISEGVAVVTSSSIEDEIRAYDVTDGTELWNVTDFYAGSTVVLNGTLYVERTTSHFGHRLHAYDLHDGTQQWYVEYADGGAGGMAASGDTVYVTGWLSDGFDRERAVYALNASDGTERWRFEVEGPIAMDPVVVNGTVYVGGGGETAGGQTFDPKFYALNRTDGHVEWIYDAHARPSGAAVAGGSVYVSIGNGIHALDADTGERQWIHRLPGDIDYGLRYTTMDANTPAVADGVVYVTNDRGFVVAIDGGTGGELWTYRVAGQATDPLVADDRLYVHAGDDNVVRMYALEAEPFAFSGLTASTTTPAPGEAVTVDVTVENLDDETRDYNLSLMADSPLHVDPWAVDRANGTLNPADPTTVTFVARLNYSGPWDLSIRRNLEEGPAIGPITVDVSHPEPAEGWPTWGFDAGLTSNSPNATAPKRHLQERWNVSNFHRDTRPAIANGKAFVVHDLDRSGKRTIYSLAAYDLDTGARDWEFNISARNRLPAGSATVENDTVYLYTTPFLFEGDTPVYDGSVFALNAADGSVAWTHDTSLNYSVNNDQAPVVADGTVYVAGGTREPNSDFNANASVLALSTADGTVEWEYQRTERGTTELFYSLAVADGTVYAAHQNEEWEDGVSVHYADLVAIDAAGGSARWTTESRAFDLDLTEQPVVRGDLVYVINETTAPDGDAAPELHALNVSDGGERWRYVPPDLDETADGWRLFDPVVTDDAVFLRQYELGSGISYDKKHLYRLDANTGALDWNRSTYYHSTLLAADGLLYAGEGDDEPTHLYDALTGEKYGTTDITARASGTVLAIANGTMLTVEQSGQPLRALAEGGAFEFTDLAVDSERVDVGENVTVTATVTNVGTMTRSYDVNLVVSPDQDHHVWNYPSRDGTLAAGASETVTWKVRLHQRGDFVFTLSPSDDAEMNRHVYDLTHGVTASVGDDRDGETIPFVGPREMPTDAGSWPKESHDAGNTGNNTGTGAPTAVGNDTLNWSINHSYEWTSGPTLANGTVFVGGNHVSGGEFVYAYNATDGALRWQYQTYSSTDLAVPPTYAGGYLYVGTTDGRVYQFDAASGERLWTYDVGQNVAGITVVDGVAYVSGYGYEDSNYFGLVHALNASTREVLWTFERDGTSYYGTNVKPAVEDGTVYVTSNDGYTYALDAATGAVTWRRAIAGSDASLHSPVVEDGVVYVDDGTDLYALDATSAGSTIWSTPASVSGDTGSSPALGNDTLYFVGDGAVQAVDATSGDALWSTTICSAASYSPAYADGVVYVPTTDSAIRAYDADTGDLVWRYDAYGEESFSPAVVGGLLYATGLENTDDVFSLAALEGGPTNQSKTLFDYSGLAVSKANVSTGESFTVSATVENKGDAACGYTTNLSVEGSVVDTTTGTVDPGYYGRETVEFTHSFSSTGTYNVTIEDLPPVEVNVSAPQPDVDVTPPSWDYGTVAVDEWVYQDFEVTNVGTDNLDWSDSTLTGPDADEFDITTDQSDTYVYLSPGNSGWVRVYIAPTTPGTKTATLQIHSDDPDEPTFNVSLTGTVEGGQQEIQVKPESVEFGHATVGSSEEANVTVENVGDATLTFDGVTLGSSDFGSFSVVAGDSQVSLAPGETHNVTLEFAPTSANPDVATLQVHSDDPNNATVYVTVSGTGVTAPEPDVDVSPMGYFYESVSVDGTDSSTFLVNNTGDATLNVTDVTVTGQNGSEFTPLSVSFTVAPGGSFGLPVNFEPTTLGSKSALLEITSNDTDEPTVVVELGGEAVDVTSPSVKIIDVAGSHESGTTVYANETVSVEVNATDEHSQIDQVVVVLNSTSANFAAYTNATYDVPSGNWTASFGSVDVPDDGAYAVEAAAIDSASNVNWTTSTQTVVVDRTAPQLGASLIRVDETTAAVNLTASEPIRAGSLDVTVTEPDGTETNVPMDGAGDTWNGTFQIAEDGQYTIDATAVDRAGNHGRDNATATFETVNTTNKTVTVVLEPSGTFVRFDTDDDVENTFVVLTDSRTPLAPLGNDRAGLNFLRAQLGAKLEGNMTNATIGVPVDELRLPRGAGKDDVRLSYFNETEKEWEDLTTEIRTVTINGIAGEYWITEVDHFSTYGAVVTDTNPPTLDATSPSETLSAGSTRADVRFDYSDDISGVDASSVVFTFDGSTVSGSRLSVTTTYASYDATGLSAGTYPASVTVSDLAGNADTFTTSVTVDSVPSGESGNSGEDGGSGSPSENVGSGDDEPTTTKTTTTPTPTSTTPTSTSTPTPGSPTTADTPTDSDDGTPTPGATQSTQAPPTTSAPGQPGFGLVVTVLALLAALLLAGRRR